MWVSVTVVRMGLVPRLQFGGKLEGETHVISTNRKDHWRKEEERDQCHNFKSFSQLNVISENE